MRSGGGTAPGIAGRRTKGEVGGDLAAQPVTGAGAWVCRVCLERAVAVYLDRFIAGRTRCARDREHVVASGFQRFGRASLRNRGDKISRHDAVLHFSDGVRLVFLGPTTGISLSRLFSAPICHTTAPPSKRIIEAS